MRQAVIIRMKYPEGSEKWAWRRAFFQAMVIPFWERQTNPDFDLWVMCNDWHSDELKDISPLINTFNVKARIGGDRGYTGRMSCVEPHQCNLFGDYDIQTCVDCDEIPNYDFIQSVYENMGDDPFLLAYKRIRFYIKDMRLYKIIKKGDQDKQSSVLSMRWPGRYIYELRHKAWARAVQKAGGEIKILEFGHIYCTAAWDNADARLMPKDELI
jgi:hypothetical protein